MNDLPARIERHFVRRRKDNENKVRDADGKGEKDVDTCNSKYPEVVCSGDGIIAVQEVIGIPSLSVEDPNYHCCRSALETGMHKRKLDRYSRK